MSAKKARLSSIIRMKSFGWICVWKNVANVKMLPFINSQFPVVVAA